MNSSLIGNLITIITIGAVALVLGVIVLTVCWQMVTRRTAKKLKEAFKIYLYIVLGLTGSALLIFVMFFGNYKAKSHSQRDDKTQAPLPKEFVPADKAEIEIGNEKAVSEKSEQMEKEAKEENKEAMDDAINTFRNTIKKTKEKITNETIYTDAQGNKIGDAVDPSGSNPDLVVTNNNGLR